MSIIDDISKQHSITLEELFEQEPFSRSNPVTQQLKRVTEEKSALLQEGEPYEYRLSDMGTP